MPYVVYCGTVFHKFLGILHNLQCLLIAANDLVCLVYVIAMLQARYSSSFAEG